MKIEIFVNLSKTFSLEPHYLAEQLFVSGIPSFEGTKVRDPSKESFEIPGNGGGYIWSSTDSDGNVIAAINDKNSSVVEVFFEDKAKMIAERLREILPRHTYDEILVHVPKR
jgi:hypothetical protein